MNPDVFLRAAESIASGSDRPSCVALDMCEFACTVHGTHRRFYAALFSPVNSDYSTQTYCHEGWWGGDIDDEENQQCRVIALLLAHEIAKDQRNA